MPELKTYVIVTPRGERRYEAPSKADAVAKHSLMRTAPQERLLVAYVEGARLFSEAEHDFDCPWPLPADCWLRLSDGSWVAQIESFNKASWWAGRENDPLASAPESDWYRPIDQVPEGADLHYATERGLALKGDADEVRALMGISTSVTARERIGNWVLANLGYDVENDTIGSEVADEVIEALANSSVPDALHVVREEAMKAMLERRAASSGAVDGKSYGERCLDALEEDTGDRRMK